MSEPSSSGESTPSTVIESTDYQNKFQFENNDHMPFQQNPNKTDDVRMTSSGTNCNGHCCHLPQGQYLFSGPQCQCNNSFSQNGYPAMQQGNLHSISNQSIQNNHVFPYSSQMCWNHVLPLNQPQCLLSPHQRVAAPCSIMPNCFPVHQQFQIPGVMHPCFGLPTAPTSFNESLMNLNSNEHRPEESENLSGLRPENRHFRQNFKSFQFSNNRTHNEISFSNARKSPSAPLQWGSRRKRDASVGVNTEKNLTCPDNKHLMHSCGIQTDSICVDESERNKSKEWKVMSTQTEDCYVSSECNHSKNEETQTNVSGTSTTNRKNKNSHTVEPLAGNGCNENSRNLSTFFTEFAQLLGHCYNCGVESKLEKLSSGNIFSKHGIEKLTSEIKIKKISDQEMSLEFKIKCSKEKSTDKSDDNTIQLDEKTERDDTDKKEDLPELNSKTEVHMEDSITVPNKAQSNMTGKQEIYVSTESNQPEEMNATLDNDIVGEESEGLKVFRLEFAEAVNNYIDRISPDRHAFLAFQNSNRFQFTGVEKEIVDFLKDECLVGFHALRYNGVSNVQGFLQYHAKKYSQSEDIHKRELGICCNLLMSNDDITITEDLIWLFTNNDSEEEFELSIEEYYCYVLELSQKPKPEAFVFPCILSDFEKFYIPFPEDFLTYFIDYINRQYFYRYLPKIAKEAEFPALCFEKVLLDCWFGVYRTQKVCWTQADTSVTMDCQQETFTQRAETEKKDNILYAEFYRFLKNIKSSILDFDTHWVNESVASNSDEPKFYVNNDYKFISVYFGYYTVEEE